MKIITAVLLSLVLLQIMVSCPERFPNPRGINHVESIGESGMVMPKMSF